ncbi:MAG TPA: MerR family transcriptional regulator [Methyloceanibacter sp.]|jgi:chaperone modulatory protein CbpM|nr:MerR family transcriptional regulator [Methyloceanibacter sp.]
MLTEGDIVARVQHVTVTRLRVWVRAGWIRPVAKAEQGFSEADMARAALIRDLEDKLGFDEDQVPVLLNLIDQIHGLRAELKTMLEALEDLPEDVRATVKSRIAKNTPRKSR